MSLDLEQLSVRTETARERLQLTCVEISGFHSTIGSCECKFCTEEINDFGESFLRSSSDVEINEPKRIVSSTDTFGSSADHDVISLEGHMAQVQRSCIYVV